MCPGSTSRRLNKSVSIVPLAVIDWVSILFLLDYVTSCQAMSYHVMSCHVMSFYVISCHIMSYHVISSHIMSYIMSFHVHYTFPTVIKKSWGRGRKKNRECVYVIMCIFTLIQGLQSALALDRRDGRDHRDSLPGFSSCHCFP
jgi:hypothetical protein